MDINELLNEKRMTKYSLSKKSGVPYTTISDICLGKTRFTKCNGETIYLISKALGVSMEDLVESQLEVRPDFELFKSNVCHDLKRLGDIEFLIENISNNSIKNFYEKKWYRESFYMLAMVDYLSRINNVPLCNNYDSIRKMKLDEPLFPSGILTLSAVTNDEQIKKDAIKNSIPEFIRFNIVESEIRNVI